MPYRANYAKVSNIIIHIGLSSCRIRRKRYGLFQTTSNQIVSHWRYECNHPPERICVSSARSEIIIIDAHLSLKHTCAPPMKSNIYRRRWQKRIENISAEMSWTHFFATGKKSFFLFTNQNATLHTSLWYIWRRANGLFRVEIGLNHMALLDLYMWNSLWRVKLLSILTYSSASIVYGRSNPQCANVLLLFTWNQRHIETRKNDFRSNEWCDFECFTRV